MLKFIRKHTALCAYGAGSAIVTLITVLRFFRAGTVFDLIGQQVITQQMLAGQGSGASLGVTNYILKMFAFYVPLNVLPGSPRWKLLILTVLINVATFIAIGLLLQKILKEFKVTFNRQFYVVLLWLAVISGSVYWIQFTNSRNLEVAGGLLLTWLSIRLLKKVTWQRVVALTAYSGLLFFADNLQVYMTAVPLLLFAGGWWLQKRAQLIHAALLAGVFGVGFVLAKLLFIFFGKLLDINYILAQGGLDLSDPVGATVGTAAGYAHLLIGGVDSGLLCWILNALLFGAMVAIAAAAAIRRKLNASVLLLGGSVIVVNSLIYLLSGYSLEGGAERYLIMTVPAFMLLFAAVPLLKYAKQAQLIASVVIAVNVIVLSVAFVQSWPNRFKADAHIEAAYAYVSGTPNVRAYASMDTAITGAYLSGDYTKAALPLSCEGTLLRKTTTFYAGDAYKAREQQPAQSVAIILDGEETIRNTPSLCNKQSIINQLGAPIKQAALRDGSTVLLFPVSVAQNL